jgi:hypothetical protein
LRLEYHVNVSQQAPAALWFDTLLDIAPTPLAPTYGEMLYQALNPVGRAQLLHAMQTQFDCGIWYRRWAVVYLGATRT